MQTHGSPKTSADPNPRVCLRSKLAQNTRGNGAIEYDTVSLPTKEAWFNLYPNPNSGIMTLEYYLDAPHGTLLMYDIWGRSRSELKIHNGYHKEIIEAPDTKGAIYLYQIFDHKQTKLSSGRVVVIPK